jgi:hypothetical protein
MFSNRFNRPVILTRHAVQRMVDRSVTDLELRRAGIGDCGHSQDRDA